MSYTIRRVIPDDTPFLWQMLFYAAHMDEEGDKTPEDAQTNPFLAQFVVGWGRDGDVGVAAVETTDETAIGAAWLRVLPEGWGYPNISSATPELAIAVLPDHIGQGIGAALLARLFEEASPYHTEVVLSVRNNNPARRLYERHGFVVVGEVINRVGGVSYVMRKALT